MTLLVKPLGLYMTRVFNGGHTLISFALRPVGRAIYALSGIRENEEQDWKSYGLAMLVISIAGFFLLYALKRLRPVLPLNPQHLGPAPSDIAFNAPVRSVSITNWQSSVPESTMSYLTQMAGLTVQNFVSAAAGIALSAAFIRGFARRSALATGNFWDDMTRCVLYLLLPLSIGGALSHLARRAAKPQSLWGGDGSRGRQAGHCAGKAQHARSFSVSCRKGCSVSFRASRAVRFAAKR